MHLGYVLGRFKPAERAIPIRADDIFVVSFFKSGNTWIRFLLGNLLNPGTSVTFESVERTSPDIYQFQHRDYAKLPSPRVIKSHECFDPRYRRIIYIVRDPRDVAVSLYHFLRKIRSIDDTFPLATYASEWFLRGKGSGRTWREHVGSWLLNPRIFPQVSGLIEVPAVSENRVKLADLGACEHGREFLLLRYEDLLSDPCGNLARIATFLHLNVSGEQIADAVKHSSAREMSRLEQTDRDRWFMTQHTRKDINFVREAKAEQWRTALPPESIAKIEAAWGRTMQLLGYGLAEHSAEAPVRSRPPLPDSATCFFPQSEKS
jgi:Sulfotransferase domain